MHNRLLTVVALLSSAVVGCDDPEVQEKAADILEHGVVSAELTCSTITGAGYPGTSNLPNTVYYSAVKNIDGSCFSQLCLGAAPSTLGHSYINWTCQSAFKARSSVDAATCTAYVMHDPNDGRHGIDKPFRPGVDGTYAFVEDGNLYLEVRDYYFTYPSNNCNAGPCTDPEPWFTYDITDPDCTGRNLEAFGATP